MASTNVNFANPSAASIKQVKIDAASNGDNTLIAAVAGQTIRVMKLVLVVTTAVTVKFTDGAGGTAFTGAMSILTGGVLKLDLEGEPHFVTSSGNAFVMNLGAGQQVSGTIQYTQS